MLDFKISFIQNQRQKEEMYNQCLLVLRAPTNLERGR